MPETEDLPFGHELAERLGAAARAAALAAPPEPTTAI